MEKGHTAYPMINVTVGEPVLLEAKIYENQGITNLRWVQYCFGATANYMSLENCEALVEVHLESNGTTDYLGVEKIVLVDEDNLIEQSSVNAITYVTQCNGGSDTKCGKVDLLLVFREAPINHMVIVEVADKPGNSQQFAFNDGLRVLGQSVNAPPTFTKFDKQASQDNDDNWRIFTRTDKVNDIWIDDKAIEYHRINDNLFERITPLPESECNDKPLDQINVPTRINCNYSPYKDLQEKNTLELMEIRCPSCLLPSFYEMKEPFSHDFAPRIEKLLDPEVILLLELEEQKAMKLTKDYTKNQYLYQKDSYKHWNYFGDMTLAEINQMDLEKKLLLQDEMLQQRLADKVQYSN